MFYGVQRYMGRPVEVGGHGGGDYFTRSSSQPPLFLDGVEGFRTYAISKKCSRKAREEGSKQGRKGGRKEGRKGGRKEGKKVLGAPLTRQHF